MSGGKSSSSTETKTSQETTTQDVSGVVGDVVQAENVQVTESFGDNVKEGFLALIELSNKTIEGAGSIAEQSVERVAERSLQAENPDIARTGEIMPYVIGAVAIGAVAWVVVTMVRGK